MVHHLVFRSVYGYTPVSLRGAAMASVNYWSAVFGPRTTTTFRALADFYQRQWRKDAAATVGRGMTGPIILIRARWSTAKEDEMWLTFHEDRYKEETVRISASAKSASISACRQQNKTLIGKGGYQCTYRGHHHRPYLYRPTSSPSIQ